MLDICCRWRKDYLNGVWTRYPCGVACGAGDLVEQQKPLEGGPERPVLEMMGYARSQPAFASFPQSAQADLISPIAHDFNRGTDMWTRYPCGVACGAGELVEQQKPLEGGSWTTSALYLQGISLVRRNSEWHHFDPLGTAGVITNSSASVVSNNLYDLFGVKRYEQGSAETPIIRNTLRKGDDEIAWLMQAGYLTARGLVCGGTGMSGLAGIPVLPPPDDSKHAKYCWDYVYVPCRKMADDQYQACLGKCPSMGTCGVACLLGPIPCAICLGYRYACIRSCASEHERKLKECERLYWQCMGMEPVPLPPDVGGGDFPDIPH